MAAIRAKLTQDKSLPPGSIEYGGLYQQQQESFLNLLMLLVMAVFLVFTVLVVEFRSFYEPSSIVFEAVLALFGTVAALWLTGTTFNIVSFLGAIIGVGIVTKNGILMLDFVDRLRAEGPNLEEALVRSGHRRLRPVLMTSLAAALGTLPLAYGIGSGGGHASSIGCRRDRLAVHLRFAFSGRYPNALLPAYQSGADTKPGSDHTFVDLKSVPNAKGTCAHRHYWPTRST